MNFLSNLNNQMSLLQQPSLRRYIHVCTVLNKVQSGRYKPTLKKTLRLTYEMANRPHYIAHRKSWNSWNTSNIVDGNRPAETALEDIFIRRFMTGTWHNLFISEIIIKRQHNLIRIGGIIQRSIHPSKIYFLTGYTEEFLSRWLQSPVKIEIVTALKDSTTFKYI
ncbi:28S ribosomal protein S24, mitochondrial isoform X1 [Vespa crabro]|uniref:28S ribosomal protein S24, mitochondrial isoform X1 n=1 Tax=Vespa crabro TaxID=7445 RepID=UPI001F0126A8|nr:28S ribosomal protein S24, mitochondrial isoform X1 [Vespa crabro]